MSLGFAFAASWCYQKIRPTLSIWKFRKEIQQIITMDKIWSIISQNSVPYLSFALVLLRHSQEEKIQKTFQTAGIVSRVQLDQQLLILGQRSYHFKVFQK